MFEERRQLRSLFATRPRTALSNDSRRKLVEDFLIGFIVPVLVDSTACDSR